MPHTSLYKKIIVKLSIPLAILAFAFTGIQLVNQINYLNNLNKVESLISVEMLKADIPGLLISAELTNDLTKINSYIESLKNAHNIDSLDIFSIPRETPFISDKYPAWDSFDRKIAENSFGYTDQYSTVHPMSKTLVSYVQIRNSEGTPRWIARITFTLTNIQTAIATSRWSLIFILLFVLLAAFIIAQALAISIVNPIQKLDGATREIMEGHLGKHVKIRTGDEIEKLANTFNEMSSSLKQMQERAADANPLTNFPGNREILKELQKRILERQKFVLFHIDLDRFKIFNDAYGLVRGDEVLHKTAELISETKKNKGTESDFIGHQGGDDFILITRPNHAESAAQYLIDQFDHRIVASMYKPEDFKNGYILAPDRRGAMVNGEPVMVKFPLMAISLAGISNAEKDFADVSDCLSKVNAVKKIVKQNPKSCYQISA